MMKVSLKNSTWSKEKTKDILCCRCGLRSNMKRGIQMKGDFNMKYSFTGKNIEVTEGIKEKSISKINRLSKLFPEGTNVTITISVAKLTQKVEVTIPLQKRVLRAEASAEDLYAAIDEVVDILEKQMIKYKTRLRDKSRRESKFKDEYNVYFKEVEEVEVNDEKVIEKSKKFAVKPMDAEEAVMEMDLLGHNFYVFRNADTDEINVVYKRNNGSYGHIEPEC